jgi:hypothetical protein
MTKVIGKYNVTISARRSWKGGVNYFVTIMLYDDFDEFVSKKSYVFEDYEPDFDNEEQVDIVFQYPNNTWLKIVDCTIKECFMR